MHASTMSKPLILPRTSCASTQDTGVRQRTDRALEKLLLRTDIRILGHCLAATRPNAGQRYHTSTFATASIQSRDGISCAIDRVDRVRLA